MIVRARIVLTMHGPPVENGAVAISGKNIVDVGPFPEVRARNSGEIVDLGERALLPGLINAHCHLDYTCLRGKIPRQNSFADWIRAINVEKAKLSAEDYVESITNGFAEAKRFGTTTVVNLTAFPELISRIQAPIRTNWFGELIDVRGKMDVDLAVRSLRSADHWGLAPHAPFTASAELYRRCEVVARLLTTHVGESREEMSMFRDASGPLYDFLNELGRDMSDCGGNTPLAEFVRRIGRVNKWIVAHLNELDESDFRFLKGAKSKFSIVHCPRSHEHFGHSQFQFERLAALGFNICVGTDSLASNQDLNLFAELRAFQRAVPNDSPEQIFKFVTTNPARALQQQNALGQIRAGFRADLIAIPCRTLKAVYDEVVAFEGAVESMLIDGEVSQSPGNSQKPLFFSQT
jgi:cytosine/adenosine deaminase-related metal-dependent hydrolase